jgi:glycosyltransferase involved in cell wall biosynthesis
VDETHFSLPTTNGLSTADLKIPTDKLIIGLIGRISRVKGQQVLLRAAAKILESRQDLCFLISGKPVEISIDQLRDQAIELGIEKHCLFLPVVPCVADLITACDICVTASVGSETISRVVLEYLYLGKPIIGTSVNAIGEIVIPGVNGELVTPNNIPELVTAIMKLANNSDLRRQYAENSYNLYLNHYNEQVFYQAYTKVLMTCISNSD